jgi:ribosomal protein S18 acetylase RimI-like enzyme
VTGGVNCVTRGPLSPALACIRLRLGRRSSPASCIGVSGRPWVPAYDNEMQAEKLASHRAYLANIAWHCLAGPHAPSAQRYGGARRYAPQFAAIAAFAEPHRPDLTGLSRIARAGETLYLLPGAALPRHADWEGGAPVPCLQMLRARAGGTRQLALVPRRLQAQDAPALQRLVDACKPGPFTPSMLALGDFYGVRSGDRLVACAGTRLNASGYREISTVCVHPDLAGRGLATQLVQFMAAQIEAAGERAFLHVAQANTRAVRIYERCGFEVLQAFDLQPLQKRARVLAAVVK